MIELIIVVTLILLIRLMINPRQKNKDSAAEKENNWNRKPLESIIGASTFVLNTESQKQVLDEKPEEPPSEFSGKMDVEIPLDYEPDNELQEEQEELQRLGLQNDYSHNVTPDEMISVVNEVGNDQTEVSPETGELLYENENTNWVEQLSLSSKKNTNRISALIDLHLGRLGQSKSNTKPDDGFNGFDIGEYVG